MLTLLAISHTTASHATITYELRDIFLALDDEEVMRELFEPYAVTRGAVKFLGRENKDLLSTIETYTKPFQALAAFWSDKEKVSLNEWAEREDGQILLLGHDHQDSFTSQRLIRVIFRRVGQAILSGPKYGDSRITDFIFDEFPQCGELVEIERFIPTVRQYGGSFTLGVQGFPQMLGTYNEHLAKTILELCGTKIIFHSTEDTAKYVAERVIGSYEFKEKTETITRNPGGHSFAEGEVVRERVAVLESEIAQLPLASPEDGVQAFYVSSALNNHVWFHRLYSKDIPAAFETRSDELDYDPETDPTAFEIKDWSNDERPSIREDLIKGFFGDRYQELAREVLRHSRDRGQELERGYTQGSRRIQETQSRDRE